MTADREPGDRFSACGRDVGRAITLGVMRRFVVRGLVGLALCAAVVSGAVAASPATRRSASSPVTLPPGLPTVPSMDPSNRQAFAYFLEARRSVDSHDATCQGAIDPNRVPAGPAPGMPSRLLLRDFDVLGLPATDEPARPPANRPAGRVFVRHARIARRADGTTFVVFPIRDSPQQSVVSITRCQRLIDGTLRIEVRNVPQPVRDRALRVARELNAENRYITTHPDAGVCVSGGHGGEACSTFLPVVTGGLIQSGATNRRGATWAYLVPNGVASITAHYPAEPRSAGDGRELAPATFNAPVTNNLAVWRTPHEPGDLFPDLIQWKSADGRTVRTTYP